jgi:hypothetical protein
MKDNFKRGLAFTVVIAIICTAFITAVNFSGKTDNDVVYAADNNKVITLQIDNPQMTVNDEVSEIDPGNGTTPVIVSDRTLVPIRAIIEAMGGSVDWDNELKETTLTYNDDVVKLVIDSTTAYLNDAEENLDTAPAIINNRTMLPIRFIAESFGFAVDWDSSTRTIKITEGENNTQPDENNETKPVVYFTSEISSDAIMEIYNKLNFKPEGNVAIKLSTGEPPASYYLDPNLIKYLVQSVNGTIVECNTAYGGSRVETAMHKQVAEDHGFTDIADVDIMDEEGSMQIPVSDKAENLKYDVVGSHYANYDSMIVLSHFKGHAMGGFGGAIKNISIGVSSSRGKQYIHSGGNSETAFDDDSYKKYYGTSADEIGANFMTVAGLCTQDQFLESMAEAAQAVHNNKQENGGIVYISVMNHLSVDCDCNGRPEEPDMHDVGILASTDPVALDQACVDIVYKTPREESAALIERIESRNGIHTLEHAEKIGLGSRTYNLVNID